MEMGGKTWEWQENFKEGDTNDFIQYEILIKLKDSVTTLQNKTFLI